MRMSFLALAFLIFACLFAAPADAAGNKSVYVDNSVIESMGPPPSIPLGTYEETSSYFPPCCDGRVVVLREPKPQFPPMIKPQSNASSLLRDKNSGRSRYYAPQAYSAVPGLPNRLPSVARADEVRKQTAQRIRQPGSYSWSDLARSSDAQRNGAPRGSILSVLQPQPAADDAQFFEIAFDEESSDISQGAMQNLKQISADLKDKKASIEVYGYSGSGDASQARREALTRTLAVRSQLLGMGISPQRITMKPIGIAVDGGAPDRVDLVIR